MTYRTTLALSLSVALAFPALVAAADGIDASLVRVYTGERSLVQRIADTGADIAGRGRGFVDVVVHRGDRAMRDMLAGVGQETILEDVNAPFEAFREVADLGVYHTLAEVRAEVDAMVAAHPDLVSVEVIGQSVEGRELLAVKVSDNVAVNEAEPAMLFLGAVHAREWIGVETVMALLHHLVEGYGVDPAVTRMVNEREIWIVPSGNPDGLAYSQGEYKMWRKNRRLNANGSYGIDLNRNWPYAWGGEGSSSSPGADTYHGTGPASEPEIQAVCSLVNREGFVASIACHSYSELVLWPFGCTEDDPEDVEFFALHGTKLAGFMGGYTPEQASDLYVCSGVSDDWFYAQHGMFSFTFEFGKQFVPEQGDVAGICSRFVTSSMYVLENCADPFPLVMHTAVETTTDAAGPYQVEARFNRRHHADFPLAGMALRYATADGEATVAMTAAGDDRFTADLPGTGYGERRYRIEARGTNGTTVTFPGDGGWYRFDVVDTLFLLVDDDRGQACDYHYTEAFRALGLPARVWDHKRRGTPDVATMLGASAVVWLCGSDSSSTLEDKDQAALSEYMARGGRLLVFGQDIGYDIKDSAFFADVLRARYWLDKSGVETVRGAQGSFLEGLTFSLAQSGDNIHQSFPEAIYAMNGSRELLGYVGGEKPMTAAVQWAGPTGRMAYVGFGLEGVAGADNRKAFMEKALAWVTAPGAASLVRATALGERAASGDAAARAALDGFWATLPSRLAAAGAEATVPRRPSGVEPLVFERYRSAQRRAVLSRGRED